jgi:sulfatase maturation enzyme AslB (radical SAM superfamily)/glycosyltransferase involved in cell wall biosynthesis
MTSKIDLSIIIPLYNTVQVPQCIEALSQLNVKEIIIVDSSPMPSEMDFKKYGITYMHVKNRLYAGAARNLGATVATGRWLFFVDADIEMTHEGLQYVRDFNFADTQTLMFGPYAVDRQKQSFSTHFQNLILQIRFFDNFKKPKYATVQASHFLICRESFWHIGGFDENLRFREDHTFCVLAQKWGYHVLVDARFTAYHHRPFTPLVLIYDYFRRQYLSNIIRLQWPQLHGGENVPAAFTLTWILGCLIPVFLSGMLLGIVPVYFLISFTIAVFILPLLICRTLFSRIKLADRLCGLAIWPMLGWALAAGTILSYANFLINKTKQLGLKVMDAARMGLRVLLRNGWPVALVHFLNSKCNLRCSHCFYKETLDQPNSPEMTVQKLSQISKEIGPLLWYSVGGGEPFLRKDMVQALTEVSRNSRPWILSIPTNGWYTDKIFISLRRLIEANAGQRIMLTISLDGPQKIHDTIRGKQSWEKAHRTFFRLKELQKIYPQLSLGVITVVDEANADVFPNFIDELVQDLKPQQIAINIYRDSAPSHQHSVRVLSAHDQAVKRYQWHCEQGSLIQTGFFAQRFLRAREFVKNQAIAQVAGQNEFVTPCVGGNLFYTIWEDGRLSPCEIRPEIYGNLISETWVGSVISKQARESRKEIRDKKCKCTYECAMSVNALFSWPLAKKTIQYSLRPD